MKTEKAEPVVSESEAVLILHAGSVHDGREVICKKGAESFTLDQTTYARTKERDAEQDRDIFIPRPRGEGS